MKPGVPSLLHPHTAVAVDEERALVSDEIPFSEKVKYINFASAKGRQPKATVDVHDDHEVKVTEHWDDRVDVTVQPPHVGVKTTTTELR